MCYCFEYARSISQASKLILPLLDCFISNSLFREVVCKHSIGNVHYRNDQWNCSSLHSDYPTITSQYVLGVASIMTLIFSIAQLTNFLAVATSPYLTSTCNGRTVPRMEALFWSVSRTNVMLAANNAYISLLSRIVPVVYRLGILGFTLRKAIIFCKGHRTRRLFRLMYIIVRDESIYAYLYDFNTFLHQESLIDGWLGWHCYALRDCVEISYQYQMLDWQWLVLSLKTHLFLL